MLMNRGLGREDVKKILRFLESNRLLRTTFANFIGATRFKALKEGQLRRTRCPNSGGIDSWSHSVNCWKLKLSPIQNGAPWMGNIKRLLQISNTDSPAMNEAADLRIAEH